MKVLNMRNINKHSDVIYIGRGSPWGNPYRIGEDGNRTEVIEAYRKYARRMLSENPHWLRRLEGKDLVCYCAPQACHGDVLLEMMPVWEEIICLPQA